jgi:hypothetical protein
VPHCSFGPRDVEAVEANLEELVQELRHRRQQRSRLCQRVIGGAVRLFAPSRLRLQPSTSLPAASVIVAEYLIGQNTARAAKAAGYSATYASRDRAGDQC